MLELAGIVVMAILAASGVSWTLAIVKLFSRPKRPLIEWSPRRPVPWALIDLVIVVAIYILAAFLAGGALRNWAGLQDITDETTLTLDERQWLVLANVAISLAVVLFGVPAIVARTWATSRDLGLVVRELASDLKLGVIAFVMLAPPVYLVQGILVQFWPSKHPLMEMFRGTPDVSFFVVLFIAAAVVAPLFEEIVFRVLLQGFLEKAISHRGSVIELIIGGRRVAPIEPLPEDIVFLDDAAAVVVEPAGTMDPAPSNPYAAPVASQPMTAQIIGAAESASASLRGHLAWLPIAISSIIFALLHWSHGPDWVPLLFLAAGMGYLYQRTHRILPSIVVHTLLNSLSMWGLWLQVYKLPKEGLGQ